MLMRLLQEIAAVSGPVAQADLARQLGVSEALVAPMIDDLVRLGYLAPVEAGCGQGCCSGCSLGSACSAQPQARLWALSAKGRAALAKGASPQGKAAQLQVGHEA